jgi:hypothetical protein
MGKARSKMYWTQAEDDLLRSLVDRDLDGENDERPALSWKGVAARMNDYATKSGQISNNGRVYHEHNVRARWRLLQEKDAKIDPYAEEVAKEQRPQENKSNVDTGFEDINAEQFGHGSKR